MTVGWGTRLDMLHCPTCGVRITDFAIRSDPEEFDPTLTTSQIMAKPAVPWYIRCPQGHKWTVKTVFRAVNEPDSVQLGDYLGAV